MTELNTGVNIVREEKLSEKIRLMVGHSFYLTRFVFLFL